MFCFKITFVILLFVGAISMKLINVSSIKIGYTMPESCRGQTYCTEFNDEYPSDEDFEEVLDPILLPNNTDRIGLRIDQINMSCRGNHTCVCTDDRFTCWQYAKIYYIVDKNNETLPVIQVEEYFIQMYELRFCNMNGASNCEDQTLQGLHVGHVCETQEMYFDFLVLNKNKELQLTQALIPVCCKCTYK